MSYFSITRDKPYPFFCNACLVGKPLSEQSNDSGYCHARYDFLLEETRLIPSSKRPTWIPRIIKTKPTVISRPREIIQVARDVVEILSTLENRKITVDKIQTSVANTRRGRKRIGLPKDLIREWASEGLGSKAVATKLRVECGVRISYKTIQRRLNMVGV